MSDTEVVTHKYMVRSYDHLKEVFKRDRPLFADRELVGSPKIFSSPLKPGFIFVHFTTKARNEQTS